MSRNISKLSGRKGLDNNLFERITSIGEQHRIPDKAEMEKIASDYNIGKANIFGASTFYEFLGEEYLDKKAYVCNGSACLCAGTQQAVSDKLSATFGKQNIGHMTCLGRCHENSAFHINGKNYSGIAIEHLDQLTSHHNDNYSVSCVAKTPILTGKDFSDTGTFKIALKKTFSASKENILSEVKISNLRGRGGAGFPTGIKWESCKNIAGDEKYIICNADEGDPGAYSDRYLLEQQPYRVLFGMLVAGWIAGAKNGVLYIRAEYPESIQAIDKAISDLKNNTLLGDNILGSDFCFNFKIIKGAGAYICGEETALIASIEGRRAEVDVRPPFPTVEGLYKKPTIVNNVETFAAIPKLLEVGGKKFSSIGNISSSQSKSTGTKLVSLDGNFNKPGIVEVDMGYPLIDLINKIGGGFRQPVKALHIGGPLGGLVPESKWGDLTIDFESFSKEGFLLGHASIVCIPEMFSVAEYIQHLFAFTKAESCGKCFPCRLGATRGKEMFDQALEGKRKLNRVLLNDLLDTMQQGSLCALGGGLPLPIKNALQYFEAELAGYFDNQIASQA
jgi:NADH:ubiquinone oxidoreductase subunit F (NADH-binding)/NADH:ubiquinone oxidoreductase subunit E